MKLIKTIASIMIIVTILCSCSNQEISGNEDIIINENRELEVELDNLKNELINLELENQKLLETNEELLETNEELKTEITIFENKETKLDKEVHSAEIKEGELFLYDGYAGYDDVLFIPAYGPVASLNPYAVNISGALSVISQDEHLARVVIEGYIPTWYIREDGDECIINECVENRYIINNCDLYLSPDTNDKSVNELKSGTAVKVKQL